MISFKKLSLLKQPLSLKKGHFLLFAFLFNILLMQTVNASEKQAINLNPNTPIIKDSFEWQIILDLSLAYQPELLNNVEQTELPHFIQPGLYFDISYKGFFLQTNPRRASSILDSAEFGYQLTVKDTWQLDIIAKAYIYGFNPDSLITYENADQYLYSGLKYRSPTTGIALRYSYFFNHAIFSIDFAKTHSGYDQHDNHVSGVIVDSFYSYLLPYRNWDIYLGVGLTYYEDDIVNYYYGIESDEANLFRPEFSADSSVRAQFEVYVQYPLSQSWSFNAGITQSIYSANIKDSPLVDKNVITQVMAGVQYVF
jgi:MipA family protein